MGLTKDECYDDYYDDRIALGSAISRPSRFSPATCALRLWDGDEYVLVTAGHVACHGDERDDDTNSWEIAGREMYHPYDGYRQGGIGGIRVPPAGTVKRIFFWRHGDISLNAFVDVATIQMGEYYDNPGVRLADGNGGYGNTILGTVPVDRLEEMEDNRESVIRQGSRTGRCESTVTDVASHQHRYEVYFETDDSISDNGDSGGPYFIEENGSFLAAGIHYGGNSIGYSAAAVEKLFDGQVA